MSWMPGWDSVEGADHWHNIFFWAGIALLVLLAASETISQIYSWHKDALISKADRDRVSQQQQTDSRRDQEVAKARSDSQAANDELVKLKEESAPRQFSEVQKNNIISAISPFRGQPFKITSNIGDVESDDFAKQFYDIINKAGWSYQGYPSTFETRYADGIPIGVEVTINDTSARKGRVLEANAYNALIYALHNLGIVGPTEPAFINPGVSAGTIEIRVGSKPAKPGQTSADRHPEKITRSP